MSTIKRDPNGGCIRITTGGMVKVDGIPACRRIEREDGIYLQFLDRSEERSRIRGTNLVEIRLDALINKVS
jgi:hypothetical protein